MSSCSLKLLDRFKPNGVIDKVLVAQTFGDGKMHLNLSSKPQGVCVEDTISRFKKFLDDTLTLDKNHLYEMCDELEKLGLPWCTPNGTKVNYHLKDQTKLFYN